MTESPSTPKTHPGTAFSCWLFLRLLGAVYLVAFLSLWPQVSGLIGHHGILPVERLLQVARQQLGPERYWALPTLCWLNASDGFLHGLCAAGSLLSLLLILDILPALVLIMLWVFYLSLVTAGQDFLSFQWDNLLLEAGFLAVFLAPLRVRPAHFDDKHPPSPLVVWLLRWLLFRLMFSSGMVKLASGDPTWRHLAALTYHYETQPLPTWIGWYAHQLPLWVQQALCLAMFMVELGVPFLIFGTRRARTLACTILVAFQLLIIATGNYGFFNLLTIVLCVLLLDDAVWPSSLRAGLTRRGEGTTRVRRWTAWVTAPVAVVIMTVTAVQLSVLLGVRMRWPLPVAALVRMTQPFRTVNHYGLFAVMTTSRIEIVLEGSRDGQRWATYEFRYKPGDLKQRPRFVAPHQPRLDWQMWFAALGSYRENEWFLSFCERLLRGAPEVLSLLAANPFPGVPPRYLRAVAYEYHFTNATIKRAGGMWWRREFKGLYCPVLSRS